MDLEPAGVVNTGTPSPRRTSAAAVAGLIFSLLGALAPLGLALSIIGLFQTRDGEVGGRTLAVIGTAVGIAFTVPLLTWFFFLRQ